MKKLVFLLTLCLCNLAIGRPIQDRKVDPEGFLKLRTELGIAPDENIVTATQKRWLRKPGQERWEMAELSTDQRSFVLKWAKEQGLYAPWKPSQPIYDKAFILGATTSRMQMRLTGRWSKWSAAGRLRSRPS